MVGTNNLLTLCLRQPKSEDVPHSCTSAKSTDWQWSLRFRLPEKAELGYLVRHRGCRRGGPKTQREPNHEDTQVDPAGRV